MKKIFKHALIIFIMLVFSGISINGEDVNDKTVENTPVLSINGETTAAKIIETIPEKEVTLNVNKMKPFAGLLDINNAPLKEFYKLPIDKKLAYNMWYYREFHSYYTSYYELMNVKGMNVESFLKLKTLIYVKKHKIVNPTSKRLNSLYYILARQSDEEGLQEGVTDEWTDYLLSPFNINRGTYDQFLNMPNVSPVDAYAISMKLKDSGSISSRRSLRNTSGLSSWGYRNLRNFVDYSDSEYDNKLHFLGQIYFDNTPYLQDDEDMMASLVAQYANKGADFLRNYMNTKPALMTKLRIRRELPKFGKEIKLGGLLSRQYGDDFPITRTSKYFVEYRYNDTNKLIVGDYRLAFGQGLIMENSDYYSPRKTGFGFSKRIIGLIGDTSRTEEFRLHGVAAQLNVGPVNSTVFYSHDKKDAILNDDGTVQDYIINKPSLTNADLEELNNIALATNSNSWASPVAIPDARDVLDEKTFGANIKIEPFPGNYIAFTGYQSLYNKFFHPLSRSEFIKIINPDNQTKYEPKIDPDINDEYFDLYNNMGQKNSKRTILGGEFGINYKNVNIQGEYGKLIKEANYISKYLGNMQYSSFNFKGPQAFIVSAYTQYNSLNILALYRNIDVGYDNPYARPFAENPRFNDTFFEKASYMLANPLNGDLYTQSPWSQPEEGIYLETRYQFSRAFTISRAYIDLWRRKADNRPSLRFQGELEYKPIFALRINLKQKFLWNKLDNSDARSISRSSETTIRIRGRLSDYDQVGFEYFYSYTILPPYSYLSNNADNTGGGTTDPVSNPADNLLEGSEKLYGSSYTFSYSRHFTKTFDIRMDLTFWDSPSSSLWDWEDTRIDFMSGKGHKYWFVMTDWLSPNINLKFKFWYKYNDDTENYVRAWWNANISPDYLKEIYPYLSQVRKRQTALKFYMTILY